MRERASASIAGLWSTPIARSAQRRGELQHAAGAGAKIEQGADRLVADHRHDRRLDPLLRGVQGADIVPVRRALGEIGGGLAAPRLARHVEPRAVGDEQRVGGIEARNQVAREGAALVGEPEKRPGALALALGEPGLDQQLADGARRAAATGRGSRRVR